MILFRLYMCKFFSHIGKFTAHLRSAILLLLGYYFCVLSDLIFITKVPMSTVRIICLQKQL